jgi:tetratricopeptide (TPR) repeat protein
MDDAASPSLTELLRPAYAAFERDDAALAWQLAQEAVETRPDAFETRMFAGTAALSAGEAEHALEHFDKAFHLAPNLAARATVWLGIGRSQVELDEHLKAHQAFQRGLTMAPEHPSLQAGLGSALLGMGRFDEAEAAARKALAGNPNDARAKLVLGSALTKQNRLTEAREILEALRENSVFGLKARAQLATLRGIAGELTESRDELETLLDMDLPPPVFLQWSRLVHFEAQDDPNFRRLVARERNCAHLNERVDSLFALAKACDDIGDTSAASRYLREANTLEAARKPYDPAEDEALMQRIAELFTREFIERYASYGMVNIRPIFVVSLPRSGSTLLEQMLSTHSQVNGGGEMEHLAQIATALSLKWGASADFPNIAEEEGEPDLREAAREYQRRTARLTLIHERFTDKSIANFLYIGLIRMLLPEAKIVHIRRHPLATALGVYRQRFTRGLRFSYDLEAFARYYRAYARLMQHWRDTVPEAFVEVRYENLVREPEAQLKRIFDYAGLEFEPQCLEFHRLSRPVQTASQTQVRKPLDSKGLDRHERYRELLAPVAEALAEEIAAYETPDSARPQP